MASLGNVVIIDRRIMDVAFLISWTIVMRGHTKIFHSDVLLHCLTLSLYHAVHGFLTDRAI